MDSKVDQALASIAETLQMLTKMQKGQQKAISGTPNAQLIFGPNGIFSNFGLDDVVVNASLSPKGISGLIPAVGTVYTNPVYPFLTGFESDGDDEVDGVCDDAPGGVIEICHQTAQFGRVARGSQEMEINQLMQILNGNLNTELRLLGDVIGEGHQLLTSEANQSGQWLRSVIQTQMVIIGIEFQRWLTPTVWTGDPANNSTGGGYREFPGLDILISTGKVDAFTGVACAALDSDVKDFNYEPVDSAVYDIVEYVSMMEFYLRHVASRAGLDPTEWVIAMRPELFFELTAVWPCRYLTHRCSDIASTQVAVLNDDTNVRMRDEMRNGNFLTVNGRQIPVVTDDGIYENNAATSARLVPGEFSSDIYFLPIRAKGMPVLYWEYLDYSRAMADLTSMLQSKGRFWVTDGGRYMWTMQDLNYCFKFQGKLEPRVVLRTPHLAGRIQNVKYSPLQHLRSWNPDSPYFKKGGTEEYDTPPDFYSEWNQQ